MFVFNTQGVARVTYIILRTDNSFVFTARSCVCFSREKTIIIIKIALFHKHYINSNFLISVLILKRKEKKQRRQTATFGVFV